MKKVLLLGHLVAIAYFVVVSQGVSAAQARMKPPFDYDRIETISSLLRAAYPELAESEGMLTLEAVFPHSGGINFRFHRCRAGSGIAVPTTVRGQKPASPFLPACGGDSASIDQFFSAHIDLGSDRDRPVVRFLASGTFIDAKVQSVRELFKNRRNWTKSEALEALLAKSPTYGPTDKKKFVRTLAVDEIRKATGCRLLPDSATFEVELGDGLPPEVEWSMQGEVVTDQVAGECQALFEPFNGRLTLLTE